MVPEGRGRAAALLLAALVSLAAFADDLARGDAAWERRAEGATDGQPRPGPIQESIAACDAALSARPESLEARWKLLRALHFAGEFVVAEEDAKRARFERGIAVADAGLAQLTERAGAGRPLHELPPQELEAALEEAGLARRDVARLYFWAAIHWGAWSRTVGLLEAVREGVADRLRDYARVTVALEPAYEEGGAFRLLGRLHAELPDIPFLTGWVDRGKAIPLLERAREIDPDHPGNRLLLAITLLDLAPDRRAEAIALLEEVARGPLPPEMPVEAHSIREEARARLAELEGLEELERAPAG